MRIEGEVRKELFVSSFSSIFSCVYLYVDDIPVSLMCRLTREVYVHPKRKGKEEKEGRGEVRKEERSTHAMALAPAAGELVCMRAPCVVSKSFLLRHLTFYFLFSLSLRSVYRLLQILFCSIVVASKPFLFLSCLEAAPGGMSMFFF
ncbi:hypothetical protein CSUI_004799 [Cystoisospora suis]|uniref:Transmembrane protein n=1 Tax=Cystoisospora suis TaxID=483139 RepID=A0A2C6KZ73_9APIC|nr:hypothetical protein CSUI_004799 [Cystoisospora suis]